MAITVQPTSIGSLESFGTVFVLSGQKEGARDPAKLKGQAIALSDAFFPFKPDVRYPGSRAFKRAQLGDDTTVRVLVGVAIPTDLLAADIVFPGLLELADLIESEGVISPDSIPSAESFGFPTVHTQTIHPLSIPSAERWGTVVLGHPKGIPEIESHCDLAHDRLAEQFKGKAIKLKDWLCVFADECQKLEVALATVEQYRSLGTALGKTLELIGEILRELRGGKGDEDYRRFLYAAAKVAGSVGTANELIDILVLLDNGFDPGSIHFTPVYPAGIIMTCTVPAGQQLLGEAFARMLQRAVDLAVRLVLEFHEVGPTLFAWDVSDSDPVPPPNSGWEEEDAIGVGGIWAEAV